MIAKTIKSDRQKDALASPIFSHITSHLVTSEDATNTEAEEASLVVCFGIVQLFEFTEIDLSVTLIATITGPHIPSASSFFDDPVQPQIEGKYAACAVAWAIGDLLNEESRKIVRRAVVKYIYRQFGCGLRREENEQIDFLEWLSACILALLGRVRTERLGSTASTDLLVDLSASFHDLYEVLRFAIAKRKTDSPLKAELINECVHISSLHMDGGEETKTWNEIACGVR
jgi:hypothetical protein